MAREIMEAIDTPDNDGKISENRPKLGVATRAKRKALSPRRPTIATSSLQRKIALAESEGEQERVVHAMTPTEGDNIPSNRQVVNVEEEIEEKPKVKAEASPPAHKGIPPGGMGYGVNLQDILGQRKKMKKPEKAPAPAPTVKQVDTPSHPKMEVEEKEDKKSDMPQQPVELVETLPREEKVTEMKPKEQQEKEEEERIPPQPNDKAKGFPQQQQQQQKPVGQEDAPQAKKEEAPQPQEMSWLSWFMSWLPWSNTLQA